MTNLKVNPNPDPQIRFLCEHGACSRSSGLIWVFFGVSKKKMTIEISVFMYLHVCISVDSVKI